MLVKSSRINFLYITKCYLIVPLRLVHSYPIWFEPAYLPIHSYQRLTFAYSLRQQPIFRFVQYSRYTAELYFMAPKTLQKATRYEGHIAGVAKCVLQWSGTNGHNFRIQGAYVKCGRNFFFCEFNSCTRVWSISIHSEPVTTRNRSNKEKKK